MSRYFRSQTDQEMRRLEERMKEACEVRIETMQSITDEKIQTMQTNIQSLEVGTNTQYNPA